MSDRYQGRWLGYMELGKAPEYATAAVTDLCRRLDASEEERRPTALPADQRAAPWRRLVLAAALLAGYVPRVCLAATGRELLGDCSEPPGEYGHGLCLGYIGSASAAGVHCPPKGGRGQAIDAVMRYLRAHPGLMDYPASALTKMALTQAFPCEPDDATPQSRQ